MLWRRVKSTERNIYYAFGMDTGPNFAHKACAQSPEKALEKTRLLRKHSGLWDISENENRNDK